MRSFDYLAQKYIQSSRGNLGKMTKIQGEKENTTDLVAQ